MPRKLTQEEAIKNFRKVHGDMYDYSKVVYVNAATKITIHCLLHGNFTQTPNNHLNGKGCDKCGRLKTRQSITSSTEEFVKKAKAKHGDKYDYSKVVYVNTHTKVSVVCPIHGEFFQMASGHLSGKSCEKCSGIAKLTSEDFIERSKKIHNDKYDYSKVLYVNYEEKVIIGCPIHGDFLQSPDHHLHNKGCGKCGGTAKLTQDEFIEKAKAKHREKYDYSSTNYTSGHRKIVIICPVHGAFSQQASSHLAGCGCKKCNLLKGETAINEFLTTNSIQFTSQIGPKINGTNRRFDFIISRNGQKWFIEANGQQHYYPVSFSSNQSKRYKEQEFKDNIRRDYEKEQYAKTRGIPILVIPYWDYDHIPEILTDFFVGRDPFFSEPPPIVKKWEPKVKEIRETLIVEGS